LSLSVVDRRCFVEKKPVLELIGTLGDVRPRQDAEMMCAASPSGIDPCSSAGLD
jgi:hypothetical protein